MGRAGGGGGRVPPAPLLRARPRAHAGHAARAQRGAARRPPAALAATMSLAQRVGRAMRAALGATGVAVLQASGASAGQSVPHLHLHVVPSWDGDAVQWPAHRSTHVVDGEPWALLAEMFE
ncbi:HIT family protein [Rathayibacter caricis]|uniref:HIT family protein n=1 Tax=Rathayibacter caricis TaxID=110936 RepID=UPI0027DF0EDB|nr:HIT family protein [Rathayibacter caricis]